MLFEKKDLRETGINIIGAVPWGTHFCQFYQNKRDLLDILVPYFKKGLESNEFCMWVTAEPLNSNDAIRAMKKAMPDFEKYVKKEQIEIVPYSKWYLKDGRFEADKVLKGWVGKLDMVSARGFSGLRLTGNNFWIGKRDWKAFADYEETLNKVIGDYRMMTVCSYSLDKCNAKEVIDVVSNHQFTIIKRHGKWTLIESSEHKKAEEKILHLASFPDMTPNPVIELTEKGEVIYSNPMANRLFPDLKKLGAKHPYIAKWQHIVLQVKKNPNNNLEREISVGGRAYMQTIQYVSPAGLFRIYAKDITYRKHVEEGLRKSEAKFRALYDSNIIGVVIGDLKNNIFDANDAFLKIIGYKREELLKGKFNCDKLTVKKYKERDAHAVEELLTKGVTATYEKDYIKKDSTHVPVIIGKVLTNKDTGETIAFVLDISERKKLERRKDEFIGTASHELKTPITIIKAFTQILHKRFEKAKDKQNEYFIKNIDAQVDRLTNLVNDLLDVSKIQAGKLKFNYEMFDLDKLITKTIVDFQYVTKVHQIERYGELRTELYGDEERIHQVLVNLLSNAVKYSPNANRIIIRVEKRNESVLVSVQDFGLGIPESNKEKIFERFYTGREKEKRNIPGFGMGLYICKEIIKDHHGELWVESKRGEGSTFYFTLPIKLGDRG